MQSIVNVQSIPAPAAAERGPLAEQIPTWGWLALGAAATLLVGPRWNVAPLAWVSAVPFLLAARRARRAGSWAVLGGVVAAALTLQVLKIVTAPIPPIMALAFSLPAAGGFMLVLGAAEALRRRLGEHHGVLVFAALTALADLLSAGFTELGAWTTTANTQNEALVLLQIASVVGVWGLGFLMAWVTALLAAVLASDAPRRFVRHGALVIGALLAVLAAGVLRLEGTQGRTLEVGAVSTTVGLTGGRPPEGAVLEANTVALFARSAAAAARGAKLIAWPEAATLVAPEGEAALLEQGERFAREREVDLVLAYGVVLSEAPLSIDNKAAFVGREGRVLDTYRKHHPVPGEPSLRGSEPLRIIERPYGRVGLAICYDFDFPAMARAYGALGADLVVVPSSDWKGIDPVHTLMSRVRAIEGGFSVLRPVRWATSAGFDAYGRVRGWLPGQEEGLVLVTALPLDAVPTAYVRWGDLPGVGLAGYVLFAAILAVRGPGRRARALA